MHCGILQIWEMEAAFMSCICKSPMNWMNECCLLFFPTLCDFENGSEYWVFFWVKVSCLKFLCGDNPITLPDTGTDNYSTAGWKLRTECEVYGSKGPVRLRPLAACIVECPSQCKGDVGLCGHCQVLQKHKSTLKPMVHAVPVEPLGCLHVGVFIRITMECVSLIVSQRRQQGLRDRVTQQRATVAGSWQWEGKEASDSSVFIKGRKAWWEMNFISCQQLQDNCIKHL